MSAEQNKALSRRYIEEVFNKGKLPLADELFTHNFVDHDLANPPDFGRGPEAVRKHATLYRTAFPDARITIDDILAEGDKVVFRWTGQGTHKGELMGIKPTGKRVTVTGIDIHRFVDGKIAEKWANWDRHGMMEQLGVVTPLPKRKAA